MAFSLVYRNGSPSPVEGPIDFIVDSLIVLASSAVTRWGMLLACIQFYFLARLLVVVITALITKEWRWKLMIT